MSKSKRVHKTDKKHVKSLWQSYAPAAWWPLTVDEAQVRSLSVAYSLRELRQMASQLGIDARLSKMALARCIVSEKNIFFPNEAGNYDHNTLVYFVRKFQVLPDLSDKEALQMSNVELQGVLLGAWKGGTEESMNINLQHVIELYEIMQGMEDKFCSSHIKKLFREVPEDAEEGQLSFYDYVENSMTAVLDLYQQWLSVEDTKAKRKIFVATQIAYANAEAAVTEYLRMIRKHCKTESFNDCDADNIPPLVMHWMRTSTWDDRIILCNVTVKGRNVNFAEGDQLLPGYTVGVAVRVQNEERENVVWLGIGRPNHDTVDPHQPQPLEGSDQSHSRKPEPPRRPGSPDYSRPFDSLQLGQLMDLYERHPRRDGLRRQQPTAVGQPVAQSVVLPEAVPQPLVVPQPVATPQQVPLPHEEPEVPVQGFKEKAKELAKDMLALGMDVAQQAAVTLLIGAIFQEPNWNFGVNNVPVHEIGTTVPIPQSNGPPTPVVDVTESDPVRPSTQTTPVGSGFYSSTSVATVASPPSLVGEPFTVHLKFQAQPRIKNLPIRKYYRIPEDGQIVEPAAASSEDVGVSPPSATVVNVTQIRGRPKRYVQTIRIPEDGTTVEQAIKDETLQPTEAPVLVINVTTIAGRPRRYVQTVRIPEDGTLVDQIVLTAEAETAPLQTPIQVVQVTPIPPIRGRSRRYVQTLRIPQDGQLIDQIIETEAPLKPQSAPVQVVNVTPISERPRRWVQTIRIPEDGRLVKQTVDAGADINTTPSRLQVIQVTPITGRPRRFVQTIRIPEDGQLMEQVVEQGPPVTSAQPIPVVQITPIRGRPRIYVQTIRIPEDGQLVDQVVEMEEDEVVGPPTVHVRQIPTYRIPEDGRLATDESRALLAGVTAPALSTGQMTYPLVTVPQYAKEPAYPRKDPDPNQTTVLSTAMVALSPQASAEWYTLVSSWIYDLFRVRTPQGHPAFPVIGIGSGTTDPGGADDRVSPDFGTTEAVRTPTFKRDPDGLFRIEPLLPSGAGNDTVSDAQYIPDGTFCPAPALQPLKTDLKALQNHPNISGNTELQTCAEQLGLLGNYQFSSTALVPYVNVASFLRASQKQRQIWKAQDPKNQAAGVLARLERAVNATAVTVCPLSTPSSSASQTSDVGILFITPTRFQEVCQVVIDNTTSTFLTGLDTLGRNTRSSTFANAAQRLMNNLRALFLQFSIFKGQRSQPQPQNGFNVAAPTLGVTPQSLGHQVKTLGQELSQPGQFYNVDPRALEQFALVELPRFGKAVAQSQVYWKHAIGGYSARGEGGMPYSAVRTVNVWDTLANLFGLFSQFDSEFVKALKNLPKVLPDGSEVPQGARDLQMLGHLIAMFQSKMDPRLVAITDGQAQKFTIIDVTTAVRELNRHPAFSGFLQRYENVLMALMVWQNQHIQETYPWSAVDQTAPFCDARESQNWRSMVVYAKLNVDANRQWPLVWSTLPQNQDTLRKSAGAILKLGVWLNVAQGIWSTPLHGGLKPVHSEFYSAMIKAFEDYVRHMESMMKRPTLPQYSDRNGNVLVFQPDLNRLNRTHEDTVQAAKELGEKLQHVPSVREAARAYVEQAVLFCNIMNTVFANQAQCRVDTVDHNVVRNSLALVPTWVTVNVPSSVLLNALHAIVKDTGVTAADVSKDVTPFNQTVVYNALDMAQTAKPSIVDTSEPPVTAIIPNFERVARLLQTDPLAAGNARLQKAAENMLVRFPLVTRGQSDGGTTATTTSSVLEGKINLTKELNKFPVVPVPRSTLPSRPSAAVATVPVVLPIPLSGSSFDVLLLMPPTWNSGGSVHVKVYSHLPRVPDGADVARGAQQLIKAAQNAGAQPSSTDLQAVSKALTLWEKAEDWPVPNHNNAPIVAPDFSWLHDAMRKLHEELSRQPLPDHGTNQNLRAAALAINNVIEAHRLHQVPSQSEALVCPVTHNVTSTLVVQQALKHLKEMGLLLAEASAVSPGEEAVQTMTLLDKLQEAYTYKGVSVNSQQMGVILPDLSLLYEGWNLVVGLKNRGVDLYNVLQARSDAWQQNQQQLKDAYQASQKAQTQVEREEALKRYMQLRDNMARAVDQARNFTYNAVVSAGEVGGNVLSGLWYLAQALNRQIEERQQAARDRAQEARRLREEEDARNYALWKDKVWKSLTRDGPEKLMAKAKPAWEVTKWTAGWTWFLSSHAVWGLLNTGAVLIIEGVPMLVNGFLVIGSLSVSGWTWVTEDMPSSVGSMLSSIREGIASVQSALAAGKAWLDRLPSATPLIDSIKASFNTLGGMVRALFNAATTLVSTADLSWAGKVAEVLEAEASHAATVSQTMMVWGQELGLQGWAVFTSALNTLTAKLQNLAGSTKSWTQERIKKVSRPRAVERLRQRYGRDTTTPLTTPDDRALGGFYRHQLQTGAWQNEWTGEKLITLNPMRRELQRYGIEVGSTFFPVKAPGHMGLPAKGPELMGPSTVTPEGLTSSARVHTNRLTTRMVSVAYLRQLRTSERRRRDNMIALFHHKRGTKVIDWKLRTGLPTSNLANQPAVVDMSLANQASTSMLRSFFKDAARHSTKGHAAHSVRDTVADELEAVAAALLSTPVEKRPSAMLEALHGLGEASTLDAVVCLSASLSPMVNGFYSMVYRRDLMSYCFTRALPMSVAASGASQNPSSLLADPASVGIVVDPSWSATDAEAVVRGLLRYQYPVTPFCLVGDTSGPSGTMQCIPIFNSSVVLSGASMFSALTEADDPSRILSQAILTALATATAFVQHATTNELDRDTWESIVSRATCAAATMGAPLDLTLHNVSLANAGLNPVCQLDEARVKTLVVRSYAAGADPLITEYFKLPFRVSPVVPVLLKWQKTSGLTDLVSDFMLLERNGISGTTLLMQFRDWLIQHLPDVVNAYDRYLTQALRQSMLDRNLLLLESVRWLNDFGMQVLQTRQPLALPGVLKQVFTPLPPLAVPPAGAALFDRPVTPANPSAFLAAFRQSMVTQLGQPFSVELVQQAQEIAFGAQKFLDQTNTSGMLDLAALSLLSRKARGWPDVDITPAVWGGLLLQAVNTSLICERLPKVQGKQQDLSGRRNEMWQSMTRVVQNAQGQVTFPFGLNSHVKGDDQFAAAQADPLVQSINYAQAALKCPWRDLKDHVKEFFNHELQRLHKFQELLSNPQVSTQVCALTEAVSEDMVELMRMNGALGTAQLWTPNQPWSSVLEYLKLVEAENTALFEDTNHEVLGIPSIPFELIPMIESHAYDISDEGKRIAAMFKARHEPSWLSNLWGYVMGTSAPLASAVTMHPPTTESVVVTPQTIRETTTSTQPRWSNSSIIEEISMIDPKFADISDEARQVAQRFRERTAFSDVNIFTQAVSITLALSTPAVIPGMVVMYMAVPAVKDYLSNTGWWKQTNAMLERSLPHGALVLGKFFGEIVVTLMLGKLILSFMPQKLPNYEQLMNNSPLEALLRSGSLYNQLDAAGVDATTRKLVESLQKPDLFVAAQETLGTSSSDIHRFFADYRAANPAALTNFIETFSWSKVGSNKLALLESIRVSQLFSDTSDVSNLGQSAMTVANTMVEHAQRSFSNIGTAPTLGQVAITRTFFALADRLKVGETLMNSVEGLRHQLQTIPLPAP